MQDDLESPESVRGAKLFSQRRSSSNEAKIWFFITFSNFILAGVANYSDMTEYYYSCAVGLFSSMDDPGNCNCTSLFRLFLWCFLILNAISFFIHIRQLKKISK